MKKDKIVFICHRDNDNGYFNTFLLIIILRLILHYFKKIKDYTNNITHSISFCYYLGSFIYLKVLLPFQLFTLLLLMEYAFPHSFITSKILEIIFLNGFC